MMSSQGYHLSAVGGNPEVLQGTNRACGGQGRGAPRSETTGMAPLLFESTRDGESTPLLLLFARDSKADEKMFARGAVHPPASNACMSTRTYSASSSWYESAVDASSGCSVMMSNVTVARRGLVGLSGNSRAEECWLASSADTAPSTSLLCTRPFDRMDAPSSSNGDRGDIAAEPLASCTRPHCHRPHLRGCTLPGQHCRRRERENTFLQLHGVPSLLQAYQNASRS